MSDLTLLLEPRLVPVIELKLWPFPAEGRPRPCGSWDDTPEAWGRYWHDCLADSGRAKKGPRS